MQIYINMLKLKTLMQKKINEKNVYLQSELHTKYFSISFIKFNREMYDKLGRIQNVPRRQCIMYMFQLKHKFCL